jgi:hypothetical protein
MPLDALISCAGAWNGTLQRADQRAGGRELVEGRIPWGRVAHHRHSTIRARRCLPLTRPRRYATRSYQRRRRVCARSMPESNNRRSALFSSTRGSGASVGHANVPRSRRL